MDDAYFSCFPSCSFLYFLFHSFRVSLFFLLLFLVSLFYRWWSEWELAEQLWKLFDGLPAFFAKCEAEGLAPASVAACREAQSQPVTNLELAALVDVGERFVAMTYKLEGDGLLYFKAYQFYEILRNHVAVPPLTNTTAFIDLLHARNPANDPVTLRQYALSCIQPGLDYFTAKFNGPLAPMVKVFKGCRMWNPYLFSLLIPEDYKEVNVQLVEQDLHLIPCLDATERAALVSEIPVYAAISRVFRSDTDDWQPFWRDHRSQLPNWSKALKKLAVFVPSSAAAERVFSILNGEFKSTQEAAMRDTLEASLLVRYNGMWRKKMQ